MQDIKDCRAIDVTTEQFQGVADEMSDEGKKRETIAKTKNLASLLCKEGMRLGLIGLNYGQLVQLPKYDSVPARPYTEHERYLIWDAWSREHDTTAGIITLLTYTGIRPNEISKIKIECDILSYKSSSGAEYGYFCSGSKTKKGENRFIPYPHFCQDIVDVLRGNRTSGFLIDPPIDWSNWRKWKYAALMESLDIQDTKPYSSRHTYSDIQKRRNIAPEIMMDIMGHEDYATTVEKYHTVTDEDLSAICGAVEGMEAPQKITHI